MNTEHDETLNRRTWTGEAWLGIESMRAPKRKRQINWENLTGTYGNAEDRSAKTTGKGTYR